MFSDTLKQFKTAIILLTVFTVMTGVIYPVVVTGIAQILFNWQANGSLVQHEGKTIGSALIGQTFTQPAYFWGRPSATTPYTYNAARSSGSNLGPSNPVLLTIVKDRVNTLHNVDPGNRMMIPVDLVTASASGLDPEISPLAAMYQAHRIAKIRGLQENDVMMLIQKSFRNRVFNLLGEPRVNVLELNMALDRLHKVKITKILKE